MNILMMTNTYEPHVGGVARSVAAFSRQYRKLGHQVLVVAPEFEGMREREPQVLRIPALQNFNGSDFSVILPMSGTLKAQIAGFKADLVHSHHPFLIGASALRIAKQYHLPHVFTHHTRYEDYTHYVPGDSPILKRFAISLATHYANLCNHVFAPSDTIAELLHLREVQTPISVVPTGVDLSLFTQGSGQGLRQALNIPAEAFVVGHVGRLAPEKNLVFLAEAMSLVLQKCPHALCVIAGTGPLAGQIQQIFSDQGLAQRLIMIGLVSGPLLVSAYKAMDVFAFSSESETQGMVLTEAMAAGVPVVALDAPGVRELVQDRCSGRLLQAASSAEFAEALLEFSSLAPARLAQYQNAAHARAQQFSLSTTADQALAIYRQLLEQNCPPQEEQQELWFGLLPRIKAEWDLLRTYADAARLSAFPSEANEQQSEAADSTQTFKAPERKHLNQEARHDL